MSSCKALARRLRTRPISTAVIAAGVAVSIYKIYKKNKEEVVAEASPSLLSSDTLCVVVRAFLGTFSDNDDDEVRVYWVHLSNCIVLRKAYIYMRA